uniref:Uncharacterized protein n=2 Tax=Ornithodoros turicata TaxID=34597 RepID=A0A2R5LK05_9ACAR
MNQEEQAMITNEARPSTAADDTTTTAPTEQNQGDITCCMLGQIAGDKGYHCFAKFYAARLLMRNRNRAHNRKMSFHGRNRIPDYGRRVMQTFEQCVADRGTIFHKCCHLVAVERRDRQRFTTIQIGGNDTSANASAHAAPSIHHRHRETIIGE